MNDWYPTLGALLGGAIGLLIVWLKGWRADRRWNQFIDRNEHHATKRLAAPNIWLVARPLRDSSWWRRLRAQLRCRRQFGHCWHPLGMIDWFCCMCGGETDGWPPQRCVHCAGGTAA